MIFSLLSGGLFTLSLMLAPTPVRADPIPITGGAFEIFGFQGDRLHLEGTRGFTLDTENITATLARPQVMVECVGVPFLCAGGDRLSLKVEQGGSDLPGAATLDGQAYRLGIGVGDLEASVLFDGSLLVPFFSGTEQVSVFSPFSFSGSLARELQDSGVVTDRLVGRGTARVDLAWRSHSPQFDEGWVFQHALYEFQTPAVVPEPGTFVLVGSGIAGYLIRRRRRANGH
jgi:hypothetical protein